MAGHYKRDIRKRNLEMRSQPVGTSGTNLGATALVSLDILVEETGLVGDIPCFVLSEKPIWRGQLFNLWCGTWNKYSS